MKNTDFLNKEEEDGCIQVMKPMYVRKLTEEEIQQLKQRLQSASAFTMRRCQILLKSHEGKKAQEIAREVLCSDQTVRVAIKCQRGCGLPCGEITCKP